MINKWRHKDNKKKDDFEEHIKSNGDRQTEDDNQSGIKIRFLSNVHHFKPNHILANIIIPSAN
jgi:hypothetical protein